MFEEGALIIPSYREKENLAKLLPKLFKSYPQLTVIVVNDESGDGTKEFLEHYQKKFRNLHLINVRGKRGRGAAVVVGMKLALRQKNIQYIAEMDADFSHDPREFIRLWEKRDSQKVIIGSRYIRGSKIVNWPLSRRLMSRVINLLLSSTLRLGVKDNTNGYRLYPRQAVAYLTKQNFVTAGFINLSEMGLILKRAGFSFTEVPIKFIDRTLGKSKTNFYELFTSLQGLLCIWRKYFFAGK